MTDLARLNSATKYPSIETYHQLDPKDGTLLEKPMLFDGDRIILTEKVNGANARIIVMPDGDFYIGSREELFHAKGDRVWNTQLNIVDTLKDRADGLASAGPGYIRTYYLEVFGGGVGSDYKNYTTSKTSTDARLFDVSLVSTEVLDLDRNQISTWRKHGGQEWADEALLADISMIERIPLTPRIGDVDSSNLPQTLDETLAWLEQVLPKTGVALDDTGRGFAEGIVLRTADRVTIAKARFREYERTIQRREQIR